MKCGILNKIKNGAGLAHRGIIFTFLIFVLLDLLTTWISTPDLKYEGNRIVKLFNLSWKGMIILAFLNSTFFVTAKLLALNYLYHDSGTNHYGSIRELLFRSFRNGRLLLSIIGLGMFYSNLLSLGHVIINNYLCYLYLHGAENLYKNISAWFVERQKYFLFYLNYVIVIPGYITALIRMKYLNNKIFNVSDPKANKTEIPDFADIAKYN